MLPGAHPARASRFRARGAPGPVPGGRTVSFRERRRRPGSPTSLKPLSFGAPGTLKDEVKCPGLGSLREDAVPSSPFRLCARGLRMKATSGGLRGRGSRRGRRDCWATTAQATPSPASDLRPPTPGAAHPARGGPYAAGRGFRGTLFPPHRRPPGPPCPRHLPAAPARSPGPGCGPAAPVRRKPALAQEALAPLALRPR